MTRYQVDSDEVLGTSSAVRASIGRIQAEVGALHGQLVSLQGSWTGQAAAAFQTVAANWHSTELRVTEDLGAINQALALAGQQYAEAEATNARMFAR
ncbi:early secretory antigenic target protein ESAT-6 [Conyzicola nivalis]|jgi:early secretory antigenic target protein ESAT-6|uniref:ESAT-6-like protein n=1 Tax=Conyzicola nivalis TaxID=1477021 RepID=A0ABV2QPR6_9MICO